MRYAAHHSNRRSGASSKLDTSNLGESSRRGHQNAQRYLLIDGDRISLLTSFSMHWRTNT